MKFKFPDLAKDKPRFFLMYYTKIVQLILVYIPALVIMLADSRLMSYQDKAGFADIKAVFVSPVLVPIILVFWSTFFINMNISILLSQLWKEYEPHTKNTNKNFIAKLHNFALFIESFSINKKDLFSICLNPNAAILSIGKAIIDSGEFDKNSNGEKV